MWVFMIPIILLLNDYLKNPIEFIKNQPIISINKCNTLSKILMEERY